MPARHVRSDVMLLDSWPERMLALIQAHQIAAPMGGLGLAEESHSSPRFCLTDRA